MMILITVRVYKRKVKKIPNDFKELSINIKKYNVENNDFYKKNNYEHKSDFDNYSKKEPLEIINESLFKLVSKDIEQKKLRK